jgi:hypothetical protein
MQRNVHVCRSILKALLRHSLIYWTSLLLLTSTYSALTKVVWSPLRVSHSHHLFSLIYKHSLSAVHFHRRKLVAMAVTRSNLGPLTTAWSQPSSCSMPMAISQSDEGAFADTQTVGLGLTCAASSAAACNTGTISCSTSYFSSLDPACFPPSTTSYYSAGQGFYSPGLVCPQSYTKACETTSGGTGDFQPEYALTAGETAAGCCPMSAA